MTEAALLAKQPALQFRSLHVTLRPAKHTPWPPDRLAPATLIDATTRNVLSVDRLRAASHHISVHCRSTYRCLTRAPVRRADPHVVRHAKVAGLIVGHRTSPQPRPATGKGAHVLAAATNHVGAQKMASWRLHQPANQAAEQARGPPSPSQGAAAGRRLPRPIPPPAE